jgi:periodic tryptophan protein 1
MITVEIMTKTGFKLLFTDDDNVLMGIENLAVFSNEADDPYMTNKDDADSEEEEDFNLLPTDNLVAVGHVEGDAAILEVYGMKIFSFLFESHHSRNCGLGAVYNAEEANLYVHHETLLPALPLCMEWLDYVPDEESPGNLLCNLG